MVYSHPPLPPCTLTSTAVSCTCQLQHSDKPTVHSHSFHSGTWQKTWEWEGVSNAESYPLDTGISISGHQPSVSLVRLSVLIYIVNRFWAQLKSTHMCRFEQSSQTMGTFHQHVTNGRCLHRKFSCYTSTYMLCDARRLHTHTANLPPCSHTDTLSTWQHIGRFFSLSKSC